MESRSFLFILFFSSACDGFSFSRNHSFVKIRPRVSILDQYSFEDSPGAMLPLIQQANTEFSNVAVAQFITENDEEDDLSIVAGVAEFNRLHHLNTNIVEPPMKVWVHYTIELDNVNDSRIASYHDILVQANLVFPGTVPVVSLSSSHANISELLEFLHGVRDNLVALDSTANLTVSPQYKITDYLQLQLCKSAENSTENFGDVLTGIEAMILYRFPTNEEIEDGNVIEFLENFQAEFELCKARLENEVSADIEVFALTHWPDTSMNGFVNVSNLVEFWRRMDDWAVKTENMIILEEVFDIPTSHAPVASTLGWFRLVEDSSYQHSSEYIFESKESLAVLESTSQPSLNSTLNHHSNCENNDILRLGWKFLREIQNGSLKHSNEIYDLHSFELMENNFTDIVQVVVNDSTKLLYSEEFVANDNFTNGSLIQYGLFVPLSNCLRKDNNLRLKTVIRVEANLAKMIIVLDDNVENDYFPVYERELGFKIVKLDSCRNFIRRVLIGMEDVHIAFHIVLPSFPLHEENTENKVGYRPEMGRIFKDGINNWACDRNVTVLLEDTME